MSAGKNFIRAALEEGDAKLFRRAEPTWFSEEEEKHYEAVYHHLKSYGSLPSAEVMAAEGVPLPALKAKAGVDYYYDLLKKRFAYNAVRTRHPQLVECMKQRDYEGMGDTLREMLINYSGVMDAEKYVTLGGELNAVKDEYYEAKYDPGMRGISFGWPTLDDATSGAQGGDLIVVAGRPSLGKSWMLLNMARAAAKQGKTVCFTSMEMSLRQIARRWLGLEMRVNPNYIREGELSTMAEDKMLEAIAGIQGGIPVHLLAGDMSKKVSGVENMAAEFNPDIIYIDAAYLLSPSGAKKGFVSRWENISEVIRELKSLALRLDKPIVISVQFNRNQKGNASKEPDLGDIAGSDSIPQDASIVLGIQKGPAPNQNNQRIMDCMKNREGDTPRFATAFTFSPVTFSEVPLVEGGSDAADFEEDYEPEWMQ